MLSFLSINCPSVVLHNILFITANYSHYDSWNSDLDLEAWSCQFLAGGHCRGFPWMDYHSGLHNVLLQEVCDDDVLSLIQEVF